MDTTSSACVVRCRTPSQNLVLNGVRPEYFEVPQVPSIVSLKRTFVPSNDNIGRKYGACISWNISK